MPKGGMIYTNYGEMEVPDNFTIDAGESAWCKIEFVWMFNEWQIASAEMTNEEGDYWDESYGTLIIHVKIVSTEINKDICRLTQHHAGDIRFELRENTAVTSGNDWIVVTSRNNGRLYTVYHTLPNPPKPLNDFLAFAGNCNDMPLNDFGAWAEWARRNIVHIKYDQLGHIYERENCYDGEVERVDPPEEDPENDPQELTSQLTAPLFAFNLQPWAMQGGDGFVPTYTVLKGGNLFTDFVGVEQVMFIARNSQQQLVKVATNPAAAFPTFDINKLEFAKNVNGTSGQAYDQMVLARRNFRFNDTLTVRAGMAGLGLPQQVDLTTASISSVISHPTGSTVRKWDDPNASSDYEVYISFTPPVAGSLNTANYFVELSFRWADGSPVQISSNNQLDIIGDGEVRAQITANDDYTFPYQLSDATDHNAGDAIKITARVIYIDAGDGHVTDANITDSMLIYYSNEGDCYTDADGSDLVDESGDCYEDAGFIDARLFVNTAGQNQWTTLKPLIDVATFSEISLASNRNSFGYEFNGSLTEAFISYSRFEPSTSGITANYKWYKRNTADSQTLKFIISNTRPEVGTDLLSMTDTGISITPNNEDFTTLRSQVLDSAISLIDSSQAFFIALVPQQYYNGDSPSTWPNCASDGGEVWIEIQSYNVT